MSQSLKVTSVIWLFYKFQVQYLIPNFTDCFNRCLFFFIFVRENIGFVRAKSIFEKLETVQTLCRDFTEELKVGQSLRKNT